MNVLGGAQVLSRAQQDARMHLAERKTFRYKTSVGKRHTREAECRGPVAF